jgi:hypothetical protein
MPGLIKVSDMCRIRVMVVRWLQVMGNSAAVPDMSGCGG